MTIIVNFLGGSSIGKSTVAYDVTSRLKKARIESEIALEFAKDLVWSQDFKTLENQIFVFAHQFERIDRLIGKVDVVVTDSPLLLSTMFKKHKIFEYPFINDIFDKLVVSVSNTYNNLNYFIERTVPFNPIGRVEKTVDEAIENDNKIKQVLINNSIPFKSMKNTEEDIQIVINDIMNKLKS